MMEKTRGESSKGARPLVASREVVSIGDENRKEFISEGFKFYFFLQ